MRYLRYALEFALIMALLRVLRFVFLIAIALFVLVHFAVPAHADLAAPVSFTLNNPTSTTSPGVVTGEANGGPGLVDYTLVIFSGSDCTGHLAGLEIVHPNTDGKAEFSLTSPAPGHYSVMTAHGMTASTCLALTVIPATPLAATSSLLHTIDWLLSLLLLAVVVTLGVQFTIHRYRKKLHAEAVEATIEPLDEQDVAQRLRDLDR